MFSIHEVFVSLSGDQEAIDGQDERDMRLVFKALRRLDAVEWMRQAPSYFTKRRHKQKKVLVRRDELKG
jgi:hypothetical protein